ncbi:hypothetical protein C8J56DRAFT_881289 [Mycena floridula]|nr:hypothetical protein C8J56DRAFT_881289 [Mycena floridula]
MYSVFLSGQKSVRPPKSYVESLEKRVEATESLLKQVMSDSGLEVPTLSEPESDTSEEEQIHFVAPNRLGPTAPWSGFFGKSSEHFLVRVVADMKTDSTGPNSQVLAEQSCLRGEFWNPYPWEIWPVHEQPDYRFPPGELMMSLVDLYFRHINLVMPLLHRPTFEKLLARKEHLDRSSKFGTVLSLVLAIGSRWSTDKRVFLDNDGSLHSSGWKWYLPTRPVLFSITHCYTEATSLYDLQAICLWVIFTSGNFAPHSMWSMLGIGIRSAQAIGAHRKKPSSEEQDPITSELLKRTWCFDIDMPIDCDDEYWESPDPELAFKQPPNEPSKISFFICFIRIADLTASVLRTLYCINDTREVLNTMDPQWEKTNLVLLDSAINHWIENLPDHLLWNPDQTNPEFFVQSLKLYTSFYHLQILLHRPFLPGPEETSLSSAASLAICTSAARSCIHIVDVHYQRTGQTAPLTEHNVFISGVVLMLQWWAGRRAGLTVNPAERKADVQKCLDLLAQCEVRWASAGQFRDLLESLTKTEPQMENGLDVAIESDWSISMDAETDELLRLLLDVGTFVIPPVDLASIYVDPLI